MAASSAGNVTVALAVTETLPRLCFKARAAEGGTSLSVFKESNPLEFHRDQFKPADRMPGSPSMFAIMLRESYVCTTHDRRQEREISERHSHVCARLL